MPDQTTKFTAPPSLIAPYDVVTVISQRSLNAHLQRAYDATPLLQSASFKPPAEEEDDYSGFDVSFDAPKVELQLATENKIVVLLLNIKSGNLKYLKISGRKVNELEFPVPPITIALEVNLVSESVPFSTLPENIQATFTSSKDLEIRKTLLDFQTASLARLRKSQTTLYTVVEDISQSALIAGYVDEYLQRLAEKQDEFVFHYVASVPSAAKAKEAYVLPSIVPTGASAVHNVPANGPEPVGTGVPLGEDSLLAYLHMSEGTILPRAQLSEAAKAIIDVEEGADTPVVVISRAKFLEAVILTQLAEVNKKSTWIVDTAYVEATLVPPTVNYTLAGDLGWTDATPEQLAPTRVDASTVSKDVLAKVKSPGAWYHYRNYNHKDDTSIVFNVAEKATTENWVFVPEGLDTQGKATVHIFGSTLVGFHTKLDINGSSGYMKSEWSTIITLDSSKPGQPIVCTTDDIVRPKITEKVTEEATLHAGELADNVIKPARVLLDKFVFSLQEVAQRTTDAFRSDWPFFIPTQGGSLYVDKVYFSKGLDLVCELQQRQS
ncbi:hypothetical protein D9619_010771 [Psilocybe cf. subviscida]|uniref:Uncharacterized protein n=1 Tax=Psilocybe cf. subviscida TaxID=2480587 RepID=A0A8H5B8S2_9AGAR|nr:hypothetical protein D9619_010771 [Psilocybe cf. subviscida]